MSKPTNAQSVADGLRLADAARQWLDGPLGGLLHEQGQRVLRDELAGYFGGYLVHYGPPLVDLSGASQIQRSVYMGPALPGVEVACEEHAWPLGEHAADMVVLQHALDFCHSPHALLREAARSVRPGGHLLIVGVNPWSAWGLRHLFARDALGQARCIPAGRLSDWLSLLGFSLEKRRYGCYRPPLASPSWQARLSRMDAWGEAAQLPGAGFYLLVARKMMVGLRPARPVRRESFGQLLPMPVAKVSRREPEPKT